MTPAKTLDRFLATLAEHKHPGIRQWARQLLRGESGSGPATVARDTRKPRKPKRKSAATAA